MLWVSCSGKKTKIEYQIMCGVVGFIDFGGKTDQGILENMSLALSHRGPDAHGIKIFNTFKVNLGLAHRRLAIIELSELGSQPMNYKQFTIVYNGEVYNYEEIKSSLIKLNHTFVSGSDTEVILHAFEEWGIECVSHFIGMFAISIYDSSKNQIILIRDRLGVKPLYYYWNNGLFLFASELKSFYSHPDFKKHINKSAVKSYFEFGYIPGPNSIFENCFKLSAGHSLVFDIKSKKFEISKYWDIKDYLEADKLDISYKEAKSKIHQLMISSYNYRMISDVPVGIFLSGGYDSTSVAAVLKNSGNSKKLKTFTIGFEDGNNEAPYASEIAKHLGTDHYEWMCTSKIAQEEVFNLPFYFDEPFADSSAIPTLLLSRHVKSQVSVSLSADGGDEIFGGYRVYETFLKRFSELNLIPIFGRESVTIFTKWLSKNYDFKNERIRHGLFVLENIFNEDFTINPSKLFKSYAVRNPKEINQLFCEKIDKALTVYDLNYDKYKDLLSIPLTIDSKLYLCDDILTKVDRSAMASSLEGREPMLDHRLIEFAAMLPSRYKNNKMILKDIVHEYVPVQLMNRPKSGFSIPLESWLNSDLQFLIHEFLDAKSLSMSGLFNINFIEKIKYQFLTKSNPNVDLIWKLIQFQMWYKKWIINE
jgi:asparagine synthase (glutamine-hydrolysing)